MSDLTKQAMEQILPKGSVRQISQIQTASEDFAFVSEQVPCSFVVLGGAVEPKPKYGQHHPKVRFNEAVLPVGAAAYAHTAQSWLQENG